MNANITPIVAAFLGCIAAIFCGVIVGSEEYMILTAVFGGLLALVVLFAAFPKILPEAKILACLIVGYIVFQRLFAQLRLGQFLFVGELGLAATAVLGLMRLAFERSRAIPSHPLTAPIMLLLLFGGIRFVAVDFKQYGITAIRDFALVYYMAFYFVGYAVGKHERSHRFLLRAFYWASGIYLVLIMPLVLASDWLPGLLALAAQVLRGRDMAVVVPAYSTLLLGIAAVRYRRPALYLLALIPLAWLLSLRARVGYVAFGVTLIFYLAAVARSRSDFFKRMTFGAVLTAVATAILYMFSELSGVTTVQPVVEETRDIFDFGALQERKAATAAGTASMAYSDETIRWRAAWWQAVYDETMEVNPAFGLGFGYDLARRFNREYYGRTRGEAAARNPHNVAFTFLGRMGLLGLGLFLWLCLALTRQTMKTIADIRADRQPIESINLWLVCIVMLLVGLFSHTFEGPMAAIPFWSLLGVAVAEQVRARTRAHVAAERPAPISPEPRLEPTLAH